MTRRTSAILGLGAIAGAAAIVIGVMLSTGDSGSPGWAAPDAAPFTRAGFADAATAGDGTVTAVWTERRRGLTSVLVADRNPGGGWSSPHVVEALQPFGVTSPSVAAGPDGEAVVTYGLWARQRQVLMGAYRPAGGDWEASRALAPATRGFYSARPAVGDDGTVTVAWSRPIERTARPMVTTRSPGAPWSDGVPAGRPGNGVGDPRLALGPHGEAFVVTLSPRDRTHLGIDLARRAPDGRWTPVPGPADPAGRWDVDVVAAVDGAGRPVLAWTSMDRRHVTSLWRSRLGDGGWTTPELLDRAPGPEWFGRLTAGRAGGDVAIAWTRWERMWTRSSVRAALGGRVATIDAFDVPDIRGGVADTSPGPPPGNVLLAGGERPALVWDRLLTREPTFASRLYASSATTGGAWSGPEAVASEPSSGGWPLALGRSPDDGLVAAWARYVTPGGPGVQVMAADRRG